MLLIFLFDFVGWRNALLSSSSGQKNDSFCRGAKSMQINPLSISLWIIQVFALLFGARELNKIIRKVENVNVYWPVEQRDDPSHGRQRLLYKQGYSTLTDQHRRRSNTCKNGDPVKPTLFTQEKEVREPNKVLIFAYSWASEGQAERERLQAVCDTDFIYYQLLYFKNRLNSLVTWRYALISRL